LCARGSDQALLGDPSTSPLERMLTASDKVWLLVFTLVVLCCMGAGACAPIIYLIPPEELPAPGHNFSVGQAALCLGGMVLGFGAALTFFGFLSRRFVPAATHQRWAEYLDDDAVTNYRYGGIAKVVRWALIPGEYIQGVRMRSNNRWRGP
jgi:hypothetical protein